MTTLDASMSVLQHNYTPAPDVLVQIVDGEAVLLDLKAEFYYGLNKVGALIWQGLQQGESVDAICKSLNARYPGVSIEKLRMDIDTLLTDLLKHKLLITHA